MQLESTQNIKPGRSRSPLLCRHWQEDSWVLPAVASSQVSAKWLTKLSQPLSEEEAAQGWLSIILLPTEQEPSEQECCITFMQQTLCSHNIIGSLETQTVHLLTAPACFKNSFHSYSFYLFIFNCLFSMDSYFLLTNQLQPHQSRNPSLNNVFPLNFI